MFSSWDALDWLILGVDIVAIIIVVAFLRRKIRHKIEEVEVRQAHRLRQKKAERTVAEQDGSED